MIWIRKILFFLYGLIIYFIGLATLIYLCGFIGNFLVPNTIDGPPRVDVLTALGINLSLVMLFMFQHSLMARQSFKKWWLKIVPRPIERSTFVLFSCAALLSIFHFWQPMPGVIWDIKYRPLVVFCYSIYFLGWTIVLISTFLINHWDLFGMRQVYLHLVDKPYTDLDLTKPFFYGKIRHPLYLGFLIAFWATPKMSVAHLVFSLTITAYILIAIQLEERDLIADFKDRYLDYKKKVPMILPLRKDGKP